MCYNVINNMEEFIMGLFNKKELARIAELERAAQEAKNKHEEEILVLKKELETQKNKNTELGITAYEDAMNKIAEMKKKADDDINAKNIQIENLTLSISEKTEKHDALINEIAESEEKIQKNEKTLLNQTRKVKNAKELFKALTYAYEHENITIDLTDAESLAPSVTSQLMCMTYQDLRKEFKDNEKNIKSILESYESRYSTKANKTIYRLMVIALQAELQNVLTSMKFDKLEKAVDQVKSLCNKFNAIVSVGNQQIAPTIKKFIGEIEYLFINAVKIEYEYYVKKEREKAEQAAIREQMKQEAEERRQLEQQKKQVEKEESKYLTEIENVKAQLLATTDNDKITNLEQKIKDLQEKLNAVEEKKEDIINRQNGKAGNVYVISNLGSFGDNVFKVGMTRRLEPLDRVRELGSASVPFEFDVHAMIFSEDAVVLENKLHQILDQYRVNKVNLRKEFFKLPLTEIEKIVLEEDPAASFNETMLAEQYRQTLSLENNNI